MSIACETRRSYVKEPKNVTMDDMKLKFTKKGEKPLVSKEKAAEYAKLRWFAGTGYDPTEEGE